MAFFFLVVSGALFASSTGDNITEATEMTAIRVVSGNSFCPNQGDNSGRSRTNCDSISNASIAIVSCSYSPAIIAVLTSGYHASLLIALPGPSFCF